APTTGQMYLKVGQAIAFVNSTGEAAGFKRASWGLFGTDVFLACVYIVYLYTVTRMRMTREFNQVIPPLPDIARRLLGVHRMEV
ncbi:MAG: hypothetical protein KGJ86_10985, partial [Chloroflexota bacterium]|nr:hypothetical protein [Chloroflexota bacterium]